MTPLEYALYRLMSDFSEDFWCASWLINLEYDLWADVLKLAEVPPADGANDVEQLKYAIRALMILTGKWIVWSDDEHGPVAIGISEWQHRYAEWTQTRATGS